MGRELQGWGECRGGHHCLGRSQLTGHPFLAIYSCGAFGVDIKDHHESVELCGQYKLGARGGLYQQSNFLCHLSFHYKPLTNRGEVFCIFTGKVICRTELFSWDGRYVKERAILREGIGFSPLFSLENHSSPAPQEMFQSTENM